MTTVTAYITANADDGTEWESAAFYVNGGGAGSTGPDASLGGLGRYGGYLFWPFWRVVLNVAKNTTLTSATLNVYLSGESYDNGLGSPSADILVHFAADKVADSAQPSTSSRPSGRTKTTAIVTKTVTPGLWGSAGWLSIDITTIVQEIVNQASWASGNHITIFAYGDSGSWGSGRAYFHDYNHAGGHTAYIEASYVVAPLITGGATNFTPGETGVVFTGTNLNLATSVTLLNGGGSQAQTITAQGAGSITITVVQGAVTPGAATIRVSDGVNYNDWAVVLGVCTITGGATTMYTGETGVVFTGTLLQYVATATLLNSGGSQAQTITAQGATSLTLTNVLGNVPFGEATLRISDGTNYTDWSVTFTPIAANDYVVGASQATDESSVAYNTSPAAADGDVYEWEAEYIDAVATWSIDAEGSFFRVVGSNATTLTYRRWSITDLAWSDWGVITVSYFVEPTTVYASLITGATTVYSIVPEVTETVGTIRGQTRVFSIPNVTTFARGFARTLSQLLTRSLTRS